jgi:hypothetical protein
LNKTTLHCGLKQFPFESVSQIAKVLEFHDGKLVSWHLASPGQAIGSKHLFASSNRWLIPEFSAQQLKRPSILKQLFRKVENLREKQPVYLVPVLVLSDFAKYQ